MSFLQRFAFLLLRLFLGGMLAYAGWGKIQNADWPDQMKQELEKWDQAAKPSSPEAASPLRFYQPPELRQSLHEFSMEQVKPLAEAVRWGEFLGGIAIAIGLLTPLALLGQLTLNLSILLLGGHADQGMETANMAFLAIGFALLLARGGRQIGVDQKLHERFESGVPGRVLF